MKAALQSKLRIIREVVEKPDRDLIDSIASLTSEECGSGGDIRLILEQRERRALENFVEEFAQVVSAAESIISVIDGLAAECDGVLAAIPPSDAVESVVALHDEQVKVRGDLEAVETFMAEMCLGADVQDVVMRGDVDEGFIALCERLQAAAVKARETSLPVRVVEELVRYLASTRTTALGRVAGFVRGQVHLFGVARVTLPRVYTRGFELLRQTEFCFAEIVEEIARERGEVLARQLLQYIAEADRSAVDALSFVHQGLATESSLLRGLVSVGDEGQLKALLRLVARPSIRPLRMKLGAARTSGDDVGGFFARAFRSLCGTESELATLVEGEG